MLYKLEGYVSSKIWLLCVYQFTSFGFENANKMSTFLPLHIYVYRHTQLYIGAPHCVQHENAKISMKVKK